ncbi:hypothetical protein OHA61_39470 [Streptomyces sp. NBC_00885]|uniref:hypothetical protein n=1 Tax=Streptomyces sp. NBC_00885 TaxID=2975857 RepID=UPI0038651573|nr:hypothetical protein OHA61_39470 [Streptomyces sp. NBC_00885]
MITAYPPTGQLDDVPRADPEAVMNLVIERMAPQDLKRLVFLILNRNESKKKTHSTP